MLKEDKEELESLLPRLRKVVGIAEEYKKEIKKKYKEVEAMDGETFIQERENIEIFFKRNEKDLVKVKKEMDSIGVRINELRNKYGLFLN